MTRQIIIFILIFNFFSCRDANQDTKENTTLDTIKTEKLYVDNPRQSDSLCLKELAKAKKDIQNNKLFFCYPQGMLSFPLRSRKYLSTILRKHNILLHYEMFSDVVLKGQTQGCYGEYMDKILSERFGKNFKSSVMATADSILSVSNDTVDAYSCDTRSHLPNESPEVESEIRCKISKELRNKIGGNSPFLDIRLYVDKLGLPSGYDLWSSNEVKDQYEDELYRNALHLLNAYKTWIPGEIQGRKVNTKTNIRVYFYTE